MVSITAVSCPPQRRPQTQQAGMDARLFRNILRKTKFPQIVIDGSPSDVFNTMHALISPACFPKCWENPNLRRYPFTVSHLTYSTPCMTMHAPISLCRASYLISVSFIYHLAVAMASLLNFPASRSSSLIASSPLQV